MTKELELHTQIFINKGLYYGSNLNHSLINPNKISSNVIDVWDNPFGK